MIEARTDITALEQCCHEVFGAFLQSVHIVPEGIRHFAVCFSNDIGIHGHGCQVLIEGFQIRSDNHRRVAGLDAAPQIHHALAGLVRIGLHRAKNIAQCCAVRHGFLEAHAGVFCALRRCTEGFVRLRAGLAQLRHRCPQLSGRLGRRNACRCQLRHGRADLFKADAHSCRSRCHVGQAGTQFSNSCNTKVLRLNQDLLDILRRARRVAVGVHGLRRCGKRGVKVRKTGLCQFSGMLQHIHKISLAYAGRLSRICCLRQFLGADAVSTRKPEDVFLKLKELFAGTFEQRSDFCHTCFKRAGIRDAVSDDLPDPKADHRALQRTDQGRSEAFAAGRTGRLRLSAERIRDRALDALRTWNNLHIRFREFCCHLLHPSVDRPSSGFFKFFRRPEDAVLVVFFLADAEHLRRDAFRPVDAAFRVLCL